MQFPAGAGTEKERMLHYDKTGKNYNQDHKI